MSLHHYYWYGKGTAASPPVGADTPYADLLVSLGFVSHWPLQGADGTDVIGGHDLTLAGSPVGGTGPGGELASAIDLEDTSNQWGSVAHADLRPASAITVVAWVNPETVAADKGILATGNTSSQGYRLTGSGTTTLTFQIRDGAAGVANVTTATTITAGSWYFIAGVYNKTDLRLYTNGANDATPVAATFDIGYGGNTTYVGNWDGNTARDWDGLIAGAAVAPVAISASDVLALYEQVI